MDSFPLFSTWIQELQPDLSPDEVMRRTSAVVSTVIIGQLRRHGFWEQEDIADCRNNLLLFMEKTLGEPTVFHINKVVCVPAGSVEPLQLAPKSLHLLRRASFTIVICHPDLQPPSTFKAVLQDAADRGPIVSFAGVPCTEAKRLPMHLSYDSLGHEQDALIEVAEGESPKVAYYSRIKPVRHEQLKVRMGYVNKTAKNLTLDYLKVSGRRKARTASLDEIPPARMAAPAEEARQQPPLILARRALKKLPRQLREQIIKHEVDGLTWEAIAKEYKLEPDTLKTQVSRALSKIAAGLIDGEKEAAPGAVKRVASWLKEMIP